MAPRLLSSISSLARSRQPIVDLNIFRFSSLRWTSNCPLGTRAGFVLQRRHRGGSHELAGHRNAEIAGLSTDGQDRLAFLTTREGVALLDARRTMGQTCSGPSTGPRQPTA